jgi:CHAT domain-containing protein
MHHEERVSKSLQDHHFVHSACYGVLEDGKTFDSSFKLCGDDRLALLDIVGSRLPAAEVAFLFACHTAELTDGSIADKVLHLIAEMPYCGFRSVAGTLWAMADTDGWDMAKHTYIKSIIYDWGQSTPYYERCAKALRDAVQKLRREKGVVLEGWVNFVHYSAYFMNT